MTSSIASLMLTYQEHQTSLTSIVRSFLDVRHDRVDVYASVPVFESVRVSLMYLQTSVRGRVFFDKVGKI